MTFVRRCQWSIKKQWTRGALSIGDTRAEMGGWPEALHGAGGGEAIPGRRKRTFRQRDQHVYVKKSDKFREWHVVS